MKELHLLVCVTFHWDLRVWWTAVSGPLHWSIILWRIPPPKQQLSLAERVKLMMYSATVRKLEKLLCCASLSSPCFLFCVCTLSCIWSDLQIRFCTLQLKGKGFTTYMAKSCWKPREPTPTDWLKVEYISSTPAAVTRFSHLSLARLILSRPWKVWWHTYLFFIMGGE